MIAKFWHWLTTSRYTLALEEQVADLKREREELKAEIFTLNQCLIPTLRSMEREKAAPVTAGQMVKARANRDASEPHKIKPANWMQAKDRLEFASDKDGARFERAVEAHKEL
jgi:hypothetical protein